MNITKDAKLLLAPAALTLLLIAGCSKPVPIEFLFEPVGADGGEYTGSASFASDPWPCVNDLRTGLMWEVKTGEPGLHHAANTYTWYFTDEEIYVRGNHGIPDGGVCTGSECDTQGFVDAVNARGLCGFHDWRVPGKQELGSLMDPRIEAPGPTTDTAYFPNIIAGDYWSSTTYAYHAPTAWAWSFEYGLDRVDLKTEAMHVMLVRGEVKDALVRTRPGKD